MRRSSFLLAATLALAGCGSAPKCATFDAQGIVRASNSKEQFRSMLNAGVDRSQTAAIVRQRDGSSAPAALSKAVDAAVERHHGEWEQNLVDAWSTLSSDEIAQACTALSERDEAAFMRFAGRVGADVQKRNEPLLRRAGAEVLSAIF